MPIVAPVITTTMIGGGAPTLAGPSYPLLCNAVSLSITSYTLSVVVVNTSNAGFIGTGVGSGAILNNIPIAFNQKLTSSFIANGLLGPTAPNLIFAISMAVSSGLSTALAMSPVLGVGVGVGNGRLTHPGAPALQAILIGQFSAVGFTGSKTPDLAKAIAEGYTQFLDGLVLFHTVSGAMIPPPPFQLPIAAIPAIGKLI